jgi:hypothetical protein
MLVVESSLFVTIQNALKPPPIACYVCINLYPRYRINCVHCVKDPIDKTPSL